MSTTVVVDLDNTIFRYSDAIAGYVRTHTGRVIPSQCPSYSFVGSGWFDSQSDFIDTHKRAVEDGLFSAMATYPDARSVLARLRNQGVKVKIATARLGIGNDGMIRWDTEIGLMLADIEYDEIHFVKDKYTVDGDVYIDDAPYVIDDLDARGLDRIVYNQDYNRHYDGQRAYSWTDVLDLLRSKGLVK